MTRDEILNMPAGRYLDSKIAEMVMGLTVDYEFDEPHIPSLRDKYDEWGYLPNYSTDISAAWEVIEKIKDEHLTFDMFYRPHEQKWWVTVFASDHAKDHGIADTAPLAVCRAALLAVMKNG